MNRVQQKVVRLGVVICAMVFSGCMQIAPQGGGTVGTGLSFAPQDGSISTDTFFGTEAEAVHLQGMLLHENGSPAKGVIVTATSRKETLEAVVDVSGVFSGSLQIVPGETVTFLFSGPGVDSTYEIVYSDTTDSVLRLHFRVDQTGQVVRD